MIKKYILLILLLVNTFTQTKEFLNFLTSNEISESNYLNWPNVNDMNIVIGGESYFNTKKELVKVKFETGIFIERYVDTIDSLYFNITDNTINKLLLNEYENLNIYYIYDTENTPETTFLFELLKKNLLKYKPKKLIIEFSQESYDVILDMINNNDLYFYSNGSPEKDLAYLISLIKNDNDLKDIKIGLILNASLLLNGNNLNIDILKKLNKFINNDERKMALDNIYIKNFNTSSMLDQSQECYYNSNIKISNCYYIPLKIFISSLVENFDINELNAKKMTGCIFFAGKDNDGMVHELKNLEKATRILTSYGIENFGLISLQNDFPNFEYWNVIHRAMYNK